MQLSWIGVSAAAMIAVPASTVPTTTPMAADAHASVPAAAPLPRRGPAVVEHYVDLNSASSKELMTLPGIDAAQADRIVANRPYLTKTDLVTKDVLPLGPFLSLKHLVVALPATVSKGRR